MKYKRLKNIIEKDLKCCNMSNKTEFIKKFNFEWSEETEEYIEENTILKFWLQENCFMERINIEYDKNCYIMYMNKFLHKLFFIDDKSFFKWKGIYKNCYYKMLPEFTTISTAIDYAETSIVPYCHIHKVEYFPSDYEAIDYFSIKYKNDSYVFNKLREIKIDD